MGGSGLGSFIYWRKHGAEYQCLGLSMRWVWVWVLHCALIYIAWCGGFIPLDFLHLSHNWMVLQRRLCSSLFCLFRNLDREIC